MTDLSIFQDITFPKGFLWGTSTSGQQIDGDNNSYLDAPEFYQAYEPFPHEPCGKACNSYELWETDIALMREMNLNSYRFSCEWSRIEPERGTFDEAAIDHYTRQLETLKANGIATCLTLHHVAHPLWFHKLGHFTTLDNRKHFERFLEKVVPRFAPHVDYWIVLNELNLPFIHPLDERLNMLSYHAVGYHIVKKYSNKPVSSTLSYSPKVPLRGPHDKLDVIMSEIEDFTHTEFFLHGMRTGEIIAPYREGRFDPQLKGACDFWAINAYVRHMTDSRKAYPLTNHYKATTIAPLGDSPTHFDEIWPEIFIDILMRCKDKPVFITENGIPSDDDKYRIRAIIENLTAIREAMDLGAEVIGYSHWSLLDNWEWGSYRPTFGLVSVDRETFDRRIKRSGRFYGEIAAANALTRETVGEFVLVSGETSAL